MMIFNKKRQAKEFKEFELNNCIDENLDDKDNKQDISDFIAMSNDDNVFNIALEYNKNDTQQDTQEDTQQDNVSYNSRNDSIDYSLNDFTSHLKNNTLRDKLYNSIYNSIDLQEKEIHYEFYNDYHNDYRNTKEKKIETNMSINKIVCEICTNVDTSKHFIILSECNHVYHISCIIDEFYNTIDHENDINKEFFSKLTCFKCNKHIQYADVFSIYSKLFENNKKSVSSLKQRKNNLEQQLENITKEMDCVNECMQKIQTENKTFQKIMLKTFTLCSE